MRSVRVLPDVPAIDRTFDYVVPTDLEDRVEVGTMVRIPLSGRRVAGWVLALDTEPPRGVDLSEITKVVGHGPSPEVIELCRWAAWRWAGRLATMLRLASPSRSVQRVPPLRPRPSIDAPVDDISAQLLGTGAGVGVRQVAPTADVMPIVLAACALGQALVVVPAVDAADRVTRALRRSGVPVARWPGDWQAAAGGATVVGGRSAVFAPAPQLGAVVVIDEHDEMLQSESSPTWHARDVAVERAARAGVPCLLVSPCPSVEALGVSEERRRPVTRDPRSAERAGWAPVTVVDRRGEDTGRTGLFSSRLVDAVRETARSERRVLCVLNRTGRARLLACRSCGTLAACEVCEASVNLGDDLRFHCGRCGAERPGICIECGSTALSALRIGVTRAREELESLALEPVAAVTGRDRDDEVPDTRVVVGTEAVLHRFSEAGLVAFVDFDQELLAPRYRAAEEALALLMLGSRAVGGRNRGGRIMVQTRLPDHEVIQAAVRAEPGIVTEAEVARRRMLRFPPFATIAAVAGEAAPEYIERVGRPLGVDVLGPEDGRWLLRSSERAALLDHLATVQRPPGRLRLQIDPARIR